MVQSVRRFFGLAALFCETCDMAIPFCVRRLLNLEKCLQLSRILYILILKRRFHLRELEGIRNARK